MRTATPQRHPHCSQCRVAKVGTPEQFGADFEYCWVQACQATHKGLTGLQCLRCGHRWISRSRGAARLGSAYFRTFCDSRKLGATQRDVLSSLIFHEGWSTVGGGWLWDTPSNTLRIMESLSRKGAAKQFTDTAPSGTVIHEFYAMCVPLPFENTSSETQYLVIGHS